MSVNKCKIWIDVYIILKIEKVLDLSFKVNWFEFDMKRENDIFKVVNLLKSNKNEFIIDILNFVLKKKINKRNIIICNVDKYVYDVV